MRHTHRSRRLLPASVIAAVLGCCVGELPAAAAFPDLRPARTERVSVTADGIQGDGSSDSPALSDDGSVVVFGSTASTFAPGPAVPGHQVFAKDLRSGRLERISVATDGAPAAGAAWGESISADGRFAVFSSEAANLAPGDTNGQEDVFLRDRVTGRTELITPHTGATGGSGSPAISADGRFIAFASARADLVPGDTNGVTDVFVRDRARGTTERVSVAADGTQADLFSIWPVISADGSKVGFKTAAGNLVPEPASPNVARSSMRPQARGFVVHDRRTGRNQWGAESMNGGPVGVSGAVALSSDGRYALYSAVSDQAVPGDTNGVPDVFAKDLRTGRTERLSLAPGGAEANGYSYAPSMSADHRTVYFTSGATNLVQGDTNGQEDVFARDLRTGKVERLSVASDGAQGTGQSGGAVTDAAGRIAAFHSSSTDLVPGDTNGTHDVFIRRLR